MMDFNMRLGEKLDVLIGERKCVSMIQEITNEGTLHISAPTYRSVQIPIHAGEMMQVIYYRPQGMFSFIGGIRRVFREDNLWLVEIELKSPISKYQRRDFVRFETALTVRAQIIRAPEVLENSEPERILRALYDKTGAVKNRNPGGEVTEGITLDISGGGLRFSSTAFFDKNTVLDCTLWLKTGDTFRADAMVVRSDKMELGEDRVQKFITCIQFVNINEMDRRRIIKYIFDEQVKNRRMAAEA